MAFRFSLEVPLRVRQSVQQQKELLLQLANQRVISLQQQVADLDEQRERILTRQRTYLESGLSAAELHFDDLCGSALLKRGDELEKQLADAELLRRTRSEEFQQARRKREAMETLRRQKFEVYRQEEARQDQRRVDDLFLLRRAYLRRS